MKTIDSRQGGGARRRPEQLGPAALIAPCGMNCGLCGAFRRRRNPCPGCRGDNRGKPKTRVFCKIKTCKDRRRAGADFCIGCERFPCERLIRLDKRYRAHYGMSMIENLARIAAVGLQRFVDAEKFRWSCAGCGEMLCVHSAFCPTCMRKWR